MCKTYIKTSVCHVIHDSHTHTCKTCVCDVIHDSCMSQRHMYVTVTCHSYMYVTVICHSYMTPAWRKDMSSSRVGKSHVWLRDRCMSYMTPPLIHDSWDVFERWMSEEMSLRGVSSVELSRSCLWEVCLWEVCLWEVCLWEVSRW